MEDVLDHWKKINIAPIFKEVKMEESWNWKLVCLTSITGNMIKQILFESMSRNMKEKMVTRSSEKWIYQKQIVLEDPNFLLQMCK